MGYKDLREFISVLDEKKLLRRIKIEVDPYLEISEIVDRVSKSEKNFALLFENVKNSSMPVLVNAFGSYERMSLALEVNRLDDIADEIREFLQLPYLSLNNHRKLLSIIPLANKAINFPKYVKNAPCQEVVEMEPNLDEKRWWTIRHTASRIHEKSCDWQKKCRNVSTAKIRLEDNRHALAHS